MTNGLGAAFGGIMLFGVLLAIAGLLVVTTGVVLWRHEEVPSPVRYVAVGLVGSVVVVAGFAVVALADEAPRLAVLFGVTAGLPLISVAARARSTGASWLTVAAMSGMAWCLPFLAGIGLLFVLVTNTGVSPAVMTGLTGIVITGGALLTGEYIGDSLYPDYPSLARA